MPLHECVRVSVLIQINVSSLQSCAMCEANLQKCKQLAVILPNNGTCCVLAVRIQGQNEGKHCPILLPINKALTLAMLKVSWGCWAHAQTLSIYKTQSERKSEVSDAIKPYSDLLLLSAVIWKANNRSALFFFSLL